MIFNTVANKPPEAAIRPGRPSSDTQSNFRSTLQEVTQRREPIKPQSSDPGSKPIGDETVNTEVTSMMEESKSSSDQKAEEMTAAVSATSVKLDSAPDGSSQAEEMEEMTPIVVSSSPEPELISKATEEQVQMKVAATIAETVLISTTAGQAQDLVEKVATTGSVTISSNGMNTGALSEGLVSEQSQPGSTSTTVVTNMTNQDNVSDTAARLVAHADVKTATQQENSRVTEFLSPVTSKAAEAQKFGETQAKSDQQSAKEWAEFENRKLAGERVNMMQPSSSGENKQTGGEPRMDNAFPVARAEGTQVKFAEFNQVLPKADVPNTTVDSQDVLNQIVRKAELMFRLNSSQMKIELHPEFLGKLTIKVMVEEGAVTARFITDNHQVKQMLEANLGMLRQTLESQGLKVERAEVDVQLNQGGLFDGSEGQRGWNWDNQFPSMTTGASIADGSTYDAVGFLQEELAQGDNYGIQANGSLNFLI